MDAVKMMAAYSASPIAFRGYYVLLGLNGLLSLLVVLVLHERMKAGAPNLMRVAIIAASAFFVIKLIAAMTDYLRNILIGTTDILALKALAFLHISLGSAAYVFGGLGLVLIGIAALKTRALSKILSCILLVSGLASPLSIIGMAWLGVVLLRKPELSPAKT
jgi:hypothetical protein